MTKQLALPVPLPSPSAGAGLDTASVVKGVGGCAEFNSGGARSLAPSALLSPAGPDCRPSWEIQVLSACPSYSLQTDSTGRNDKMSGETSAARDDASGPSQPLSSPSVANKDADDTWQSRPATAGQIEAEGGEGDSIGQSAGGDTRSGTKDEVLLPVAEVSADDDDVPAKEAEDIGPEEVRTNPLMEQTNEEHLVGKPDGVAEGKTEEGAEMGAEEARKATGEETETTGRTSMSGTSTSEPMSTTDKIQIEQASPTPHEAPADPAEERHDTQTAWTSLEQSSPTLDRDLPAPPTPSKEPTSLPQGKGEVEEVARAFGVDLRVADTSNVSKKPTIQVANAEQVGSLGPPVSPSPGTSSPRTGGLRIGKGPPPTTQASEEKPFDFNRFLDQMRHKSAGPVGEYVRSFIKGFTKKPYRVSDQTKLIFDFLDFISLRMRECEVWAKLPTGEFENATEAMEKLLMNRLYNYTFSPAVRKEGKWSVQTDDLERDRVLKQRIRLFGWITEAHLDVPMGSHSKGFIDFAIDELLKMNHYKAPRDKVICILNCCKVIFGLIRHLSSEENADTFIPILIFVVLRSNPDHLISNVEYIGRFRNPERLSSESGYYLSSLMGAIAFIETMDYTSLSNITQQEFEANVEAAVEKLSAQPESVDSSPARGTLSPSSGEKAEWRSQQSGQSSAHMTPQTSSSSGEEAARSLALPTGAATLAEDTKAFFQRTGEAARVGIGASIGKPMGALGRLFQENLVEGPRTPGGTSPAPNSGRATPESPPPTASSGGAAPASARSRMWGLFGVDEDGMQHQQHDQTGRNTRGVSSSSINFGSWSRNMREDDGSDPQTPVSEELRQGRFATLGGGAGADGEADTGNLHAQLNAPRAQRLRRVTTPNRKESVDPYSILDDDQQPSGVRTPDGDGSDGEQTSPTHATSAGRPRFSDLSGFLPNFLSEQSLAPTTASSQSRQQRGRDEMDDVEVVQASEQIEQAHLAAGVETLKSIFPDVDSSVCRLVLEGCEGDVQASIDKLLEMS